MEVKEFLDFISQDIDHFVGFLIVLFILSNIIDSIFKKHKNK